MSAFNVYQLTRAPDAPRDLVDRVFANSFNPPELASLDAFPIAMYVGSAVLHAFYKPANWVPDDVDVFVPVKPTAFKEAHKLVRVEPGCKVAFNGDYLGGDSYSMKVTKDDKCLHIVFVRFEDEFTKESFHADLVERFDIKICALAWDGEHLFFPPKELVDIEKKTSSVTGGSKRFPLSDTFVHRVTKYISRGFKLTDMATYEVYTHPLMLGNTEVKRARVE